MDSRVTYIVQRADPDGAEAYLTGKVDWPPALTPTARDIDGDGAIGEDASEDIDGDGEILKMRIRDPKGPWKLYRDDARLLVQRRPEDREGPFYRVMDEGIDNDGDGQFNEDPPFDYQHTFISNRNYPVLGLGIPGKYDYPLQEHNARMIVEFIVSHPNISQVQSYHTTGGLHLGASVRSMPPQDLHDLSTLLARMSEMTGLPVPAIDNGFTQAATGAPVVEQPGVRGGGTFTAWAYGVQGLFAVTTELVQLERFLNEVGWGNISRERLL